MVLSMGRAERTREDIMSKRHRREEELSHTRIVEERLIANNEQGQAESRQRVEHAKERKEEAKLRGKEIGRQRALLHREERQRQEKERERQGERERARQEQRARRRAGGVWNRTRESQEVAGRRSYESMPATADDEEHGGENKKTRRRNASGERSESRAGRRDARDKRRRSASVDSEEVYGHGRGRSDGGGDADLNGLPTARGESTMPRSRSGRGDRETRVSDRTKERSRKSERKERRRREFRDHKGKTDVSFRASEVAWRGPHDNRSSVGDGGRWQPSPSPGAIDSMPSARSSHAPERRRSSTQLPLSMGKPNRRADSRRPRGTAPDPRTFFPSRPLLRQHGGTGTLLLPLVTRGMGSGTLDLGTRSGAGRRTGGGMGTLSVL